MKVRVAVGLGSNRGDRARTLESAVQRLARHVEVAALSPWLENPAVGGPPGQSDYLNGVLLGTTHLAPEALLALLQEIEAEHGRDREREGVHGARTLDLDLLVYGELMTCGSDLEIPHPRMLERDFVLVPLARIAPTLRLPHTGRTALEEAHRLAQRRILGPSPVTAAVADALRGRWTIEASPSE